MRAHFFLLAILISCQSELKQEAPITSYSVIGAWRVIKNDSVYNEAIILDSTIVGIDENRNLFNRKYRINDDSIVFFINNEPFSLVFTPLNKDEFILENQYIKTRYSRLDVPLPYSDKGVDAVFIDSILLHFPERKWTWMVKNGFDF